MSVSMILHIMTFYLLYQMRHQPPVDQTGAGARGGRHVGADGGRDQGRGDPGHDGVVRERRGSPEEVRERVYEARTPDDPRDITWTPARFGYNSPVIYRYSEYTLRDMPRH